MHKRSKMNQNKNENTHTFQQQGEWNHRLVFIQHRIMFSLEQPSWLHVMSLLIFIVSYMCKLGSNDNVHQNLKTIYGDKDIHSSSNVTREKVVDLLLNVCSTFQNNSCNIILKCVVGFYTFTFTRAPKQMGIYIVIGMTTLTL